MGAIQNSVLGGIGSVAGLLKGAEASVEEREAENIAKENAHNEIRNVKHVNALQGENINAYIEKKGINSYNKLNPYNKNKMQNKGIPEANITKATDTLNKLDAFNDSEIRSLQASMNAGGSKRAEDILTKKTLQANKKIKQGFDMETYIMANSIAQTQKDTQSEQRNQYRIRIGGK